MKLIYFQSPGERQPDDPQTEGVSLFTYSDVSRYPFSVSPTAVFIVAVSSPDGGAGLLQTLRHDPRTGLQPVFTTVSYGEPLDLISDGLISSPSEACSRARGILERIEQLDPAIFESGTSDFLRILGYLYSRTGFVLDPFQAWSNEYFYSYPALEAMLGTAQLVNLRLASLFERKLLRRIRLNDRIRHCPACNGVHLNYIDLCPNCKDIDIAQKAFLHCFSCGTVAPEERFLDQDRLTCPNCQARLRHIGADYDRPLENYECQKCHHTFIEPEVQARCMHCATLSTPEKLIPQVIYSYELSDLGIEAAKSGSLEDVFALLDTVNSVSPTYYLNLVNWLLALTRRHTDEQFTIIGMRMVNLEELNSRFGKQVVIELMDTLAARLRELIRTTDLTTRTGQQVFWILLPKTGQPNHLVVLNRILELKKLVYDGDGAGIDFETVLFCAPEDMNPGETGKLLLARLEGEFK